VIRQLLRRLLLAVPLALAVSFLTFLLARLAGGNYYDQFHTDRRFTAAQVRVLERRAHLDEPLLVQWLHWLRGICFDVRIGRPSVTLLGFEQPLVAGRDVEATTGVELSSSDEDSWEGLRCAQVVVPEGGGRLRFKLPVDAIDGAGEIRVWRQDDATETDGGGKGRKWRPQAVAAHDGVVEIELAGRGVLRFDALERVAQGATASFGRPDFGRSFRYDTPVFELLLPALASSFWLALATMVVTWLAAIPLGVWSATRRGGFVDRALAAVSFAGASVPGFLLALIVLYACVTWASAAGGASWLPVGADRSPDHETLSFLGKLLDRARHLVLPVAVLTFGSLASVQRTLRATLVETLAAPFVTSARARGLPERRVVRRHALRSALNPLVTLLGIRLAELLSGAALVEVVFQYPGMGRLVLEATIQRDLHVVTGAVLVGALMLVAANLLVDMALTWLDPRVEPMGVRA